MDLAVEKSYDTPVTNSSLFIPLLLSLIGDRNKPITTSTFQREYDYIIVGGGSAGSTLANRLSELNCATVLLLEAGNLPPLINDVPRFASSFFSTDLDWDFVVAPQKYTAKSIPNREVRWKSGKALGGSSLLNFMVYTRGQPQNYDEWEAMGATGWSYKDVLPYFLKMESNLNFHNECHNNSGPLSVELPRYRTELKESILAAGMEMGYPIVKSNDCGEAGFYDYQTTMRRGQRCSTSKAYLVPAEHRLNLDIVVNAFVKKVVIRDDIATGVVFDYNGKEHFVQSKTEVILAAGAINSPKILLLSGIGPKEQLMKFNIPVIKDLPVGENLQDHGATVLKFEINAPPPIKSNDPIAIEEYIQWKTGPLASTGDAIPAFLSSKNDLSSPDYEVLIIELNEEKMFYGSNPKVKNGSSESNQNNTKPQFECLSATLQPKSRGSIELVSADPYVPPLITHNYFSEEEDININIEGLKMCQKIASSKAMQKFGSKNSFRDVPECEQYAQNEHIYYECIARAAIYSMNHKAGSVKMGSPTDPTTVLDPYLRVKGIDKLRVVDASVIPKIPAAHTNVPVIMIAEKAADIIKKNMQCK